MARTRKPQPSEIHVDDSNVLVLFDNLKKADAELRKASNVRLREAAKECAGDLAQRLRLTAYGAPAPQTQLVARSIKVKSDRFPVVAIGGKKKVGRAYKSRKGRGTVRAPAAALLFGVENGDFHGRFAPRSADGNWIKPTVKDFSTSSQAIGNYQKAVLQILDDAGVL